MKVLSLGELIGGPAARKLGARNGTRSTGERDERYASCAGG